MISIEETHELSCEWVLTTRFGESNVGAYVCSSGNKCLKCQYELRYPHTKSVVTYATFTRNRDQLKTDLRVEKFCISWNREQSLKLLSLDRELAFTSMLGSD